MLKSFFIALVAVALAASRVATAQEYPDRPIKLIVPQAAGSSTDNVARVLAGELSKELGQQVYIENRPGGAFVIGNDAAAKSPPDGYTLLYGNIGGFAITPHMVAKLPYDIERDFQSITLVSLSHLMMAASPSLPVNSVADVIGLAKKQPGKLTNASSATGSPGHVGGELFKYMTGTQILHVPYKGGPAAINVLLAGRVDLMFESLNSIAPHAREKRVKALGVSGAKRSAGFPDVPTIAEAGVPGYVAPTWSGLVGPAGLPAPVLEKLSSATNRALKSKVFADRSAVIGDEVGGGTPEEFATFIKSERVKWGEVIRRAGVTLDQ
jgi:tripartite-type tricarboxylate transporter receptor subunit TctC